MHPDARVLSVARRQLFLVTRPQVLACGFTERQLRHRLATGRLTPAYAGVYLVPGAEPSPEQTALAACLACGPDAVASGRTALDLIGVEIGRPLIPEVTVPVHRRPRTSGIDIHRSRVLGKRDRTRWGHVPMTSVPRTLLDAAGFLPATDLERAVDDILRRGLLSPTALLTYVSTTQLLRRKGRRDLRTIAEDRASGGVPESELETRMLQLIRDFALPDPVRQLDVETPHGPARIDFAYPDVLLALEPRGRAPHWGRERWQSDNERHNALELAGWDVLYFTWADVTTRRADTAMTVASKLGLRPTGWRSS